MRQTSGQTAPEEAQAPSTPAQTGGSPGPPTRGRAALGSATAARGTNGCRHLSFPAQPRPTAPGTPARRPLSLAPPALRTRPGPTVAILPPAHRDRSRLQKPQRRSGAAPPLPSVGTPGGGAHLCGLQRLLLARHPARPVAAAGGGGLTPRAGLDKFALRQRLAAHFPTPGGRRLIRARHPPPEADPKSRREQLRLTLPPQPPPRIT